MIKSQKQQQRWVPPVQPQQQPPVQQQPPAQQEPPPQPVKKGTSARRSSGAYEKTATILGLIFVGAVVVGLWGAGGYFSLIFLKNLFPSIADVGLWLWAIPLAMSAAEIKLFPFSRSQHPLVSLFWLGIVVLDIGSSVIGMADWMRDKWTMEALTVWIIAGIAGLIFAFVPEPSIKAVFGEIKKTL